MTLHEQAHLDGKEYKLCEQVIINETYFIYIRFFRVVALTGCFLGQFQLMKEN